MPNDRIYTEPGRGPSEVDPDAKKKKPFRHQVGPMHDDMEPRNMPAPGEDDMGGNPLQEGILGTTDGGWAHPSKRDETYASVGETSNQDTYKPLWEDEGEVDFEIVGVVPHDEKSENPKKRERASSHQKVAIAPLVAGALALGARALPAVAGLIGRAGAGAAARGGAGGLMNAAKNYAMLHGGLGVAQDIMGGGGAAAPAAPEMTVQPPGYYSSIHNSFSPDSVGLVLDEIPGDTEDPEEVDQQEQNDGSRELGLQVGFDVNDMGGTGSPIPFSNGVMESIADSFPTIIEAILGGGQPDNPAIIELHTMIDAEIPGYLDQADESAAEELVQAMLNADLNDPLLEDNNEPHSPEKMSYATPNQNSFGTVPGIPDQNNPSPIPTQGTCANCGGTLDPSTGSCPQCSVANPAANPSLPSTNLSPPSVPPSNPSNQPMASSKLADSQGPRTDEQKAAVAEILQGMGRSDEIANMILKPWEYAEELSQVQQQDTPPDPVDPNSATGVGPMGGNPPGLPPGGGMPGMGMPGMKPPMPGMPGMPGGGMAPPPPPGGAPGPRPMMSSIEAMEEPRYSTENTTRSPAALQRQRRDIDKERDVARTWVDTDGSPLKVGREYEMKSKQYDIPDIVRIVAVKPDSIEFEITSQFGLNHRTELTRQEANMEKITFEEFEFGSGPESDGPDRATYPESTSGDQRDLENVYITASTKEAMPKPIRSVQDHLGIDPATQPIGQANGYVDQIYFPNGVWATPEQVTGHKRKALSSSYLAKINRLGATHVTLKNGNQVFSIAELLRESRNSPSWDDMRAEDLGLQNQDEVVDSGDQLLEQMQSVPQGYLARKSNIEFPEGTQFPPCEKCEEMAGYVIPFESANSMMCKNCFNVETIDNVANRLNQMTVDHGREIEELPTVDHPLGPQTGSNKQAGAKYSPVEQKDFVNEQGVARNSDKLDLSNTHYIMSSDKSEDDFLWL